MRNLGTFVDDALHLGLEVVNHGGRNELCASENGFLHISFLSFASSTYSLLAVLGRQNGTHGASNIHNLDGRLGGFNAD